MSIYYQDDHVTLYLGDALTEHREWLDADALLTDPPYGRNWRQGEFKDRKSKAISGIFGDRGTGVRDAALEAWGNRPAVVFGDLMLEPPATAKLTGIYAKPNDAGIRGAISGVRRDAEAIYFCGSHPAGISGRSSIFRTSSSNNSGMYGTVARGGHPHSKPLDVLIDLLDHLPGDVVADPFSGGGSTLIAARMAGRRSVGVELDESYAERAAVRLSTPELMQFDPNMKPGDVIKAIRRAEESRAGRVLV